MNISILHGFRVPKIYNTDDGCHIMVILVWFADADLLSVLFFWTLGLGQGALGAEIFGMALLLSSFPVSFLTSNFGILLELGTLLTIGILLTFDPSLPFCS